MNVISINLTIRNEDEKYAKIPFQFNWQVKPGYNKELIPFSEIDKRIQSDLNYRIYLTPNKIESDQPLYFG